MLKTLFSTLLHKVMLCVPGGVQVARVTFLTPVPETLSRTTQRTTQSGTGLTAAETCHQRAGPPTLRIWRWRGWEGRGGRLWPTWSLSGTWRGGTWTSSTWGAGTRGISFWVTLAYQLVSASISVWPLGCCLVITELNYIWSLAARSQDSSCE